MKKIGYNVFVFCSMECRLEYLFLWHSGNVKAVVVEGVEIGGDDFVGSKVRATQRSQRESRNVIVSGPPSTAVILSCPPSTTVIQSCGCTQNTAILLIISSLNDHVFREAKDLPTVGVTIMVG